MFIGIAARADPIDWRSAVNGVSVGQGRAYAGCALAHSVADLNARKIAVLRAMANLVRSRHALVSGSEHAVTGSHKENNSYSVSVVEESDDFVLPIDVVNEEMTVIENVTNLCVLVIEKG